MRVTNKYNSFGEVIESIRNSSSETYTYDNEGRIISHIVKDKDMGEVKTSYTYDVLGRTTSITTGAGTENITYDDAGRISVKSLPSQGTEKRYSYYKNGLLKSVLTYRNGELTNTENSEYDLSGNKTLEETDGNIRRYAYDGLNRLKSVIEHNGDQTEYEFDSFGNISKEYTLTPGDIKTKYYHYDNANRLILMYDDKTSAEYTYDAEGNMITKVSDAGGSISTSNYVYDGYNRLSEFYSQNTEAQYAYNPEGLRESKTVNGNATRFLYDNGNIIGEFTGDDYYIYHRGTELIGYTSFSGKSATYQQNSHGNVTALLDYEGAELKTYTYNAYGKEQAFTANPEGNQTILYQWKNETDNTYNPFRYCGEYVDAETGLIYLRNRYYDPSVGRFITEDPARDGLNWYAYCGNNPVKYVDPLGLDAIIITNKNSVNLGARSAGHTSAIYQNADGDWFYTYWGNKAAAVIRIPDTYVKEWRRNGDITANSMNSMSDFNNALNKILTNNGFTNITKDYTHATYIVGDFTASLKAAYADVNEAAKSNFLGIAKGLISLDDGSLVFQGTNSAYGLLNLNCFDKTYASLSKGTLANGTNVGSYMRSLGFRGGLIPNDAISKFSEVFMNSSFTYNGAYSGLSNYASLYAQNSPWAQKASKAAYANAVVGK